MNIKDLWPEGPIPECTIETWEHILDLRQKSFYGFLSLESENGLIIPGTRFETAKGQEMIRLMFFRAIEEFVEAFDSEDPDHILEELIDCFNYLISTPMIEDMTPRIKKKLAEACYDGSSKVLLLPSEPWIVPKPEADDLLFVVFQLSRLGDKLRNRAWMTNAQDIYFAGRDDMINIIGTATTYICNYFSSWDQFYRFFLAKDNVLQFRLRSLY